MAHSTTVAAVADDDEDLGTDAVATGAGAGFLTTDGL